MEEAARRYWNQELTYLKGMGPRRADALAAELGARRYADLLHYYPYRHLDRSRVRRVASLREEGGRVTLVGKLGNFSMQPGMKGRRLTATLRDDTGYVELVWFKGVEYAAKKFREGDEVVLFGKTAYYQGRPQITHPEIEVLTEDDAPGDHLRIIPFYKTTAKMKRAGVDSRAMRRVMRRILEEGKHLIGENLPGKLLAEWNLKPRGEAVFAMHFPASFDDYQAALRRLKFEELLFFELLMARRKAVLAPKRVSRPFAKVGDYFMRFYEERLPFELTGAQKRVVKEVRADLRRAVQMNRLVQGDVGSGKTMVALMAVLLALDNGFQAAMMAPTEILAEQHYFNFRRLLDPLDVHADLLTGGQRKSRRDRVLRDAASGISQVLVGTHALIEPSVKFANLGLTIIDEQHKFGVRQRAALWDKAPYLPHNLAMTATPIPRTLAMTLYGDIDVSVIDELPPGRKPVKTVIRTEARRLEVIGFLKKRLAEGRQAYIVYPLVEESAKMDLLAVKEGYEVVKRTFPNAQVGIVHGQMKSDAKEFEMQRFKKGETHVLVATTVIEVGVDVPNAAVMVIENAERFGLSQLHQLRGRVGRGADQAFCILMAGEKPSDAARERLRAMAETSDGFRLSEVDLKLRGPGDFLGTRQSGLPSFRLANVAEDGHIISEARAAAFEVVDRDPDLAAPEHKELRVYLERFIKRHNLEELTA